MLALASPASLKGVLSPLEARRAARRRACGASPGVDVDEAPVADGGEGTAEVLHAALGGDVARRRPSPTRSGGRSPRAGCCCADGTAVVESAQAIGLPLLAPERARPAARVEPRARRAAARRAGRGAAPRCSSCVGGTATVDGGVGDARGGRRAGCATCRCASLCDVRNPLLGERGAARVFGPQKGAEPRRRSRSSRRGSRALERARALPRPARARARAAGSAPRSRRSAASSCEGAELVLDTIGFDDRARGADLVVTGEGTVDATTLEGKAPGAVVRRCERLGVRCELFGGLVRDGIDAHALSGDRARAGEDLVAAGRGASPRSGRAARSSSILPRTPSSFAAQMR